MGCTGWEERISALADGELEDAEAPALFNHLGACGECRSFYRHLILLREEVHGSTLLPPVPAREGQVGEFGPEGARRQTVRSASIQISRTLAVAAAFVLLVLGGSTAALMLERGDKEAHIIYVVGLPTIEVEATYLPAENNSL